MHCSRTNLCVLLLALPRALSQPELCPQLRAWLPFRVWGHPRKGKGRRAKASRSAPLLLCGWFGSGAEPFFLSTSRRNQWALDALGKQPVAPPPCSTGYLGRSRTDWIGYALVFWNRALPRRPLMTLASQTGPGPPHSPMAGFSFGRPLVPAA
jgi:hypothetical protein